MFGRSWVGTSLSGDDLPLPQKPWLSSQAAAGYECKNVDPGTGYWRLAISKNKDYQEGFEPIPDVVIFDDGIGSDWRRRNNEKTLLHMLIAIEVKASEREKGRLRPKEIITDVEKLVAHRSEAEHRGGQLLPVILIIDSAPLEKERMTADTLKKVIQTAADNNVELLYCSQHSSYSSLD